MLTASSHDPEVETDVAIGTTRSRTYFDSLKVPLNRYTSIPEEEFKVSITFVRVCLTRTAVDLSPEIAALPLPDVSELPLALMSKFRTGLLRIFPLESDSSKQAKTFVAPEIDSCGSKTEDTRGSTGVIVGALFDELEKVDVKLWSTAVAAK